MVAVSVVATLILTLARACQATGPIVQTSFGQLLGKVDNNDCHAFLGIPFAQAPVGNLRCSGVYCADTCLIQSQEITLFTIGFQIPKTGTSVGTAFETPHGTHRGHTTSQELPFWLRTIQIKYISILDIEKKVHFAL